MKPKLTSPILIALFCLILAGCPKTEKKSGETKGKSTTKEVQTEYRKTTIATGGVTGVYYPVGRLISRIVNAGSDKHKLEMSPQITNGSVYNINAVLKGDAEFAIAQSDRQYQALRGKKEWREKGPQKHLRSICSLYPEVITLVALKTSGIKEPKDIKGKQVNLGVYGSGHLENAMDLINSLGMNVKDIKPEYFPTIAASRKLSQGAVDAFFYTIGHPNAEIKEIGYTKQIRIVPIKGPEIEALINKFSYYDKAYINTSYYPHILNKEKTIPSFAVKATLITSLRVSDKTVYAVVKDIFENLNELRTFHSALSSLKAENMFKGLSAALHPGAIKYYREKGLDKFIDPSLLK